eukprot:gene4634-6513_t
MTCWIRIPKLFIITLYFLIHNNVISAKHQLGGKIKLSTEISSVNNIHYNVGLVAKEVNGVASHTKHTEHHISMASLVCNIVADLCPHGMLPLAYGFAKGGPTGLIPALLLLVLFGFMSAYSMSSFASMADNSNSTSISEVWKKLVNEKSSWFVDVSIFFLCVGCCIFYSAFVGDIFGSLSKASGFTGLFSKRWFVLTMISSVLLLPLCLLGDLSSLQFSSILGVGSIAYVLFFHLFRNFDKTYSVGSSLSSFMPIASKWPVNKLPLWKVNANTLVLVNMLCVAYLAHYNSVSYYLELENRNIKRYNKALTIGFGISMCVFGLMMIAGYMLFGTSVMPLILNNFPTSADSFASLARIAAGSSIIFAFPLMFAGVKSSLLNLIMPQVLINNSTNLNTATKSKTARTIPTSNNDNVNIKNNDASKSTSTVIILAVFSLITAVGIKCGEEDVSVVLGIVGSLLGCFVAYVLPAFMRLKEMRLRKSNGLKNSLIDVIINHLMVALGAIFGVLGVWITITTPSSHATHH